MGYGQYSNDYHKPFTKRELLAMAGKRENMPESWLLDSRLVAKNTLKYTTHDSGIHNESVFYHKTRILTCTYDNQVKSRPLLTVTIDSGGWNTLTTRERLNRFLPSGWHVFTDKGFLFVRTPSGMFPNCDGAAYDGRGLPLKPELHIDERARAVMLKRKIDGFCHALEPNPFPAPCNGDPIVFDWNPRTIGEYVLLDWLDSKYINGSFVAACLKRKGWTDTALSMAYHRPKDFAAQIKRACRDYFKAGLGLA